ncbi:hypothetical protein AUF78_09275 [archaeon 13_1_20CM_2_51_12]|nr:MAG: hypothetical protein AUF78_09275 [archaeon 13_1_20CM_2_51_12]
MQRILWIATASLFTSTILDRLTTFMGFSSGFVETNPARAWVLAHSPWFFYSTALIAPATIGLIMMIGFRYLEGSQFQLHRRFLASFFLGLSVLSWTPCPPQHTPTSTTRVTKPPSNRIHSTLRGLSSCRKRDFVFIG